MTTQFETLEPKLAMSGVPLSVATPAPGLYAEGDALSYRVTFSEPVEVTGRPFINLQIGDRVSPAVYVHGSRTNTLTFERVVGAGENDANGVVLTPRIRLPQGAAIVGTDEGPAALSSSRALRRAVTTPNVRVDTNPATVTSVRPLAPGNFAAGEVMRFSVTFNEPVEVTGVPTLPVEIGGTVRDATFARVKPNGRSLIFRVAPVSGDVDSNGVRIAGPIDVSTGATIRDRAGNDANLDASGHFPRVVVDAVAPGEPSFGTPVVDGRARLVTISVQFDEPIVHRGRAKAFIPFTFNGEPRRLVYSTGSGTSTLQFAYKFRAGESPTNPVVNVANPMVAVPASTLLTDRAGNAIESNDAAASKYYDFYKGYRNTGTFWRTVTSMGSVTVVNGLGVWNTSGTYGAGVVSESMGYALLLSALYDDKTTFDRLSATIQAGIKSGPNGLFPWYWNQGGSATAFTMADTNSASDADINIALAYVYADKATRSDSYAWSSKPAGSASTYGELATSYIQAIRAHDFSSNDPNSANNYILADGWKQADSLFQSNNWHPDYSDPRAYQLFKAYDTAESSFWDSAVLHTKAAWKAIYYFGKNDPRTTYNASTGAINAAHSYVYLSNATYQQLQANADYSKVTAMRGGSDPTTYTADSERMPMRLLNYIQASENSSDTDMIGIANSLLTALGTSYTNTGSQYLVDKVNIAQPWSQPSSGYIQNFNAAGLLGLSGDESLSYASRSQVESSLSGKFGSNGTNGSISDEFTTGDGFNSGLTGWGLTVYVAGFTRLQATINSITTTQALAP